MPLQRSAGPAILPFLVRNGRLSSERELHREFEIEYRIIVVDPPSTSDHYEYRHCIQPMRDANDKGMDPDDLDPAA